MSEESVRLINEYDASGHEKAPSSNIVARTGEGAHQASNNHIDVGNNEENDGHKIKTREEAEVKEHEWGCNGQINVAHIVEIAVSWLFAVTLWKVFNLGDTKSVGHGKIGEA